MPRDVHLPFFAYGVFKPGELAFLQIKDLVARCEDCSIAAELRIRDGLPIASLLPSSLLPGSLIYFRPGSEEEAYRRISDLEPDKQYGWKVSETRLNTANYLAGKNPEKGSAISEDNTWDGRKDPLFTVALDVVEETLRQNQPFDWDLRPLFRLEMAYLLLWTAIERYASLRYHLGDKSTKKVMQIADECAFKSALKEHIVGKREVCRSDDPTKKIVLDPNSPETALAYYYQIRSNLVHRGKGVPNDHERIAKSLRELLAIFRITLKAAFEESQWETAVSNCPKQD